jgi:amino acid transporter
MDASGGFVLIGASFVMVAYFGPADVSKSLTKSRRAARVG